MFNPNTQGKHDFHAVTSSTRKLSFVPEPSELGMSCLAIWLNQSGAASASVQTSPLELHFLQLAIILVKQKNVKLISRTHTYRKSYETITEGVRFFRMKLNVGRPTKILLKKTSTI
jgi:hypothetical protein